MANAPQLGERDVASFVERLGLDAGLVFAPAPTPTVPDAARALGVDPGAIVKSLVFIVDDDSGPRPVLVVAAGETRVAYPKLADALGVSRRRLRLASVDETLAISGYAVGGVPPFGHRRPMPTFVDSLSVARGATVYGGGGSDRALLRLGVDALLTTTAARYLPLT